MDQPRVRRRTISVGIALVLAVGTSVLGTPTDRSVRAADPVAIDLSMPLPADLAADAAVMVVDTPAAPPDVIDVDPVIEAANADEEALRAQDWEVEALAATLGSEPGAAFELVRDSIRFDAYPGILRGAEGTLTARAGNSLDRALLLKALLDGQGLTTRFALGDLSPEAAGRLLMRTREDPVTPLPDSVGHGTRAGFLGSMHDRARRDYALLHAALGGEVGTPGATEEEEAALADIASHAWVQVEQDGQWVDLDPSLPTARVGEPMTPASSTADALPDDLRQTVTVRLIAESLTDDELATETVLEQTLDAATAADQQLLLFFGPDGGGGGGLLGGVGAPEVIVPVLAVDGTSTLGTDMVVSAEVSGGFLGGSSQVDLASLALEIETNAPGVEPVVARQMLLDRVPAAAREIGSVTAQELTPIDGSIEIPPPLSGVRHVLISTGGVSPRAAAIQRGLAAYYAATDPTDPTMADASVPVAYWPTAIAEQALVTTSELDVIPGVDDAEVRAFVARPRVYLTSSGVDAADPSLLALSTDLLIDDIRVLADPTGSGSAAEHRMWYGALQGALETEQGLRSAVVLDPAAAEVSGVSLDMAEPLTVLTLEAEATLPDTVAPRLREALLAGRRVVVPGDPSMALTWWEIADDGTTRAMLAPTLGGVTLGSGPMPPLGYVKIGGPRPPGVPRVTPPQKTPAKLPKPNTPKPPRAPSRPSAAQPACAGNEQTILDRCVAFVVQITAEQVALGILGLIAAAGVGVLIALFAGA